MEIVLVYLGKKKLPKYVIENLKYLKRTFPKNIITLISENSQNLTKALLINFRKSMVLDFLLLIKVMQPQVYYSSETIQLFLFCVILQKNEFTQIQS